ncbi:MAG: hypothetical protein U0736_13275 [Gemmataceae bacterium]
MLRPPVRPDLRQLPAFAAMFHVEDWTDGRPERVGASVYRWEYHLRPKGDSVGEVPGVPFLFYNPDVRPPAKGYQTLWTDPIPLTVRRPERPVDVRPCRQRCWSGRTATCWRGRRLGRRHARASWWRCCSPAAACRRRLPAVAAAAPGRSEGGAPAAKPGGASPCGGWSGRRRWRGRAEAEAAADALTGYLGDRFGLQRVEPTPAEAETLLPARGCPAELASEVAVLLAQIAAARFQPAEPSAAALVDAVRHFVLAVEERT